MTRLHWAAALVISALLLCLAAFINGGPVIEPDTIRYLLDGHDLVRHQPPPGIRPVFYGLAAYPLYLERTTWPIVLLQGLILAHILYLTFRACGARLTPGLLIALSLGFTVLTSLGWNVSNVLPDVFSGVLILAMFLLGLRGTGLNRWETAYVVLLATACICFHLTNVAIALAMAGLASLLFLLWRPARALLRPLPLIGCVVLAFACYFSVSTVLWRQVSLTMYRYPHLLARFVADGPGRQYLEQSCDREQYVICPYVAGLPNTEQEILWTYIPNLPITDWRRFRAEENKIVLGTALAFPGPVAYHMLANTVRQFVTVLPEINDDGPYLETLQRDVPAVGATAAGTLQFHGGFRGGPFEAINLVQAAGALISFVACALLVRPLLQRHLTRPLLLMAVVLFGLALNAFTAGALSGVFGRYQNRVVWLLPVCAVAGLLALLRSRALVSDQPRTRVVAPTLG